MSVFDDSTPAPKSGQTGNGSERKPTEFWADIGVEIPVPQQDGTMKTEFVSLPMGAPMDELTPVSVGGNPSPAWEAIAKVKNALIAGMQQQKTKLEPGDTLVLPKLKVQLRRRDFGAKNEIMPEEGSDLANMLADLFTS